MSRRRPYMTRESYLPQAMRGVAAYVPEGSDVSVWGWEEGGKLYGIAFAGKAERPAFHYSFRTLEDRQAAVDRLGPASKTEAVRNALSELRRHPDIGLGDRYYRLVAIHERTGKKTPLSDDTLTLNEAHTMRSKVTASPNVRIQVEEVG